MKCCRALLGGLLCAVLGTSAHAHAQEPAPAEPQPQPAARSIEARVFVGPGVGGRELRYPIVGGTASVDLGAFLSVDVGTQIAFRVSDLFWLSPLGVYQTSIGHSVDELHVASTPHPLAVRSHRFEASLAPELRFGDARELRLSLALGYTTRSLRPEVHHLLTPSYSLAGPFIRPALRVPILTKRLALQLAPELIGIVEVGDALNERGIESGGLGLGGEASLELRLGAHFSVVMTFRESHIVLSAQGGDASDVERFLSARIVGEL